jgi:hypothetical protein
MATRVKAVPLKTKAMDAAKEVCKEWNKIQEAGRRYTHELAGEDEFGPSLGDFKDGQEKSVRMVAEIIEKHMSKKS